MSFRDAENVGGALCQGKWNRILGWIMLVSGVTMAAVVDPWFASQSAVAWADGTGPAVRHTQGVLLGMGLLQLAIPHLLATLAPDRGVRQRVALLTGAGAVIYAAGYALGLGWPDCHRLVLLGSAMNFIGLAHLVCVHPRGEMAPQIRTLVAVVCFGMLLDFIAGLFHVLPDSFILHFLGSDEGVRFRMMRLARVAAIALSVLALLYDGIVQQAADGLGWRRLGGFSLVVGAIGMPLILTAACFSSLHWKYLLALPATAVGVGIFLGLRLALRHARRLEAWGWAMIAASVTVGMLMGLYAFDGPLQPPEFLGQGSEMPRQLSRLAHGYSIVFGILGIFLSRQSVAQLDSKQWSNLGIWLYVLGSMAAVAVMMVRILFPLSNYALGIGPAVAAIGAMIHLCQGEIQVDGDLQPPYDPPRHEYSQRPSASKIAAGLAAAGHPSR